MYPSDLDYLCRSYSLYQPQAYTGIFLSHSKLQETAKMHQFSSEHSPFVITISDPDNSCRDYFPSTNKFQLNNTY